MSIAFLATGDEIIHGDTLNTNSHVFAHALSSEGLSLGTHMACSDQEDDMVSCLTYLKKGHDTIIITGGLGPTSDDRTRFALAKVIHQPLIEYAQAVDHVKNRLKHSNYALSTGNHQQTLFPADSTLLPNPRGSAVGCYGFWENTLFILLPGPPAESLPMFDDYILPLLQQMEHSNKHLLTWLIFGFAESELAHMLDGCLKDMECQTGYRLDIPYIEFKVRCKQDSIEEVKTRIQPLINQHIIASPGKKASEDLRRKLVDYPGKLSIVDEVTGGLLQTLIQRPENYETISFHKAKDATITFHLTGLQAYWQKQTDQNKVQITIHCQIANKNRSLSKCDTETHQLPYSSSLIVHSAAEWLCFRILNLINKLHD